MLALYYVSENEDLIPFECGEKVKPKIYVENGKECLCIVEPCNNARKWSGKSVLRRHAYMKAKHISKPSLDKHRKRMFL